MAVGASFGARLEHLRARKGTKETELAKVFGINRSTIGRILKGETEKVSSQLVIDTAQYFGVSTDFLLGLTDMPDPMNHPMEEFKLTEGAAKAILYEDVHVEMLNRLLENPRFCQLTYTMAYALEPEQTVGALSFDNILAHGESLFLEVMTPSQKIKREMKKDSQKIASQIVDPNTVGNGKMLEEFRANHPADPKGNENGKAALRAGDPRISEGDGQGNPVPGRWRAKEYQPQNRCGGHS